MSVYVDGVEIKRNFKTKRRGNEIDTLSGFLRGTVGKERLQDRKREPTAK